MKLTQEEKELILKQRADNDDAKPKKVGYLKMNLYSYDVDRRSCSLGFVRESDNGMWLCEKETMNNWIKDFKSHFECVLPKGTEFVCYIDGGEESWYDNINYGLEDMRSAWAEQYLTNIKWIKK